MVMEQPLPTSSDQALGQDPGVQSGVAQLPLLRPLSYVVMLVFDDVVVESDKVLASVSAEKGIKIHES